MVEPNIIDRVVGFVSPGAALKRVQERQALSYYGANRGARYDRAQTKNWFTTRGSADADSLADLPTLRYRSRDMVRNTPIATGAIHTVVGNVVGTGLALQPTPDITVLGWDKDKAKTWSDGVRNEFDGWASSPNCDISLTQTFYELQDVAFRGALESGDIGTLLPMIQSSQGPKTTYKTRIQMIEADRIASPTGDGQFAPVKDTNGRLQPQQSGNRVYGGVEVDSYGAPVAYWILKTHPGAIAKPSYPLDAERVPAFGAKTQRRNVIHLFDRKRPDQNRGVPYLAPVMESLKQLDQYAEAELMAAVVTAALTFFIKTPTGDSGGFGMEPGGPAPALGPKPEITLGPGKVIDLAEGEDVVAPVPVRPNAGFDPFFQAILRQVGVALQLPFEVLVKHFTSSYTAARAALLEAWKFYKNRRAFLASKFCQPIFEAWMDEAVSLGRIQAPGYFTDPALRRAYLRADWIGDAPGQVDPVKEINAAKERIALGVSTGHREAMEFGGLDWDDLMPVLADEHKQRVAAGLEPDISNAAATELVGASVPAAGTKPAPKKEDA